MTENQEYRVLARKYRPQDFEMLIGQEAMVQTLSNAIEAGRLAHAFVLTGVRGVGKTTTARIIAKALNCQSFDGPTITPCGSCEACTAIAESRHVDVLEMDAASRTGVGDIREIIESVRYAPVSARFKIYIIDEVHMLSTAAFNALLKTLEEPPEHVKFIFATTEIRKIPVTVLSRCQRFDLKRVDADKLAQHLSRIAGEENAEIEEDALRLIARAAEGSVRDSLSLLDQAIAHTANRVTANDVRAMLGLADRAQVLDLFKSTMAGDAAAALEQLRRQYDSGADPVVVIGDLLEVAHWLTRLKVMPEAGVDHLVSEAEKADGGEMAKTLSMSSLTRAWQILLKGLGEVRMAPSPISAAEMLLVRLCYAADLPSPEDLVKKLSETDGGGQGTSQKPQPLSQAGSTAPTVGHMGSNSITTGQTTGQTGGQVIAMRQSDDADANHAKYLMPTSFEKMVDMFRREKQAILAAYLTERVRLVAFAPGRLEINILKGTPVTFSSDVKRCLEEWTGESWIVTLSKEEGSSTLGEKRDVREAQLKAEVMEEPLVKRFLGVFEGAELLTIRDEKEFNSAPTIEHDGGFEHLDTE